VSIPDLSLTKKLASILKKFIPVLCNSKGLTKISATFIIVMATLFFVSGYFFTMLLKELPTASDIETKFAEPDVSTKVYDKDGNLIGEFFFEKRTFVPISKVPENVIKAFISIEDVEFYKHWGISVKGVSRALANLISNKGSLAEGGSTITQQLARNLFLTHEKSWKRKFKEAILTIRIEALFSKEEILESYLNEIYLASGVYGVQEASLKYFGKPVWELDIAQAATLAAIPKAPIFYNPLSNPKANLVRRNIVLQRMLDIGFITSAEFEEAKNSPLSIVLNSNDETYSFGLYFVEYIRILLSSIYGEEMYRSGFSVYTTLDMTAQKSAESILERRLANFDARRGSSVSSKKVQGAIVAVVPQTGEIRAMVGGRDFKESQFNRAIQAQRQPGSAFKPFVYLTALNKGFTAATLLSDRPMTFRFDNRTKKWIIHSRSQAPSGKGAFWSPKNYSRTYKGDVILADAIAQSINVAAVETLIAVGHQPVIDMARKMGITSPLIDAPSLALGSSEVSLIEMVGAYAIFAAKGIKTDPFVIDKITDRNGNIVFMNTSVPERVITEKESFLMTSLLKNVISRGSGAAAQNLGRPAAGKTGTTNDSSDAWFIAFTPELSAGVWVGYDDRSVKLGNNVTGGQIATPIWTDFMRAALRGKTIRQFEQPKGIEWASVDANTGLLASKSSGRVRREAFEKGTAPNSYTIGVRLNIYDYSQPETEYKLEIIPNENSMGYNSSPFYITLRARQSGSINAAIPSSIRSIRLYLSKSNPYFLGNKNVNMLNRWILQLGRYRNAEIVIDWNIRDRNLEHIDYRRFAAIIREIVSDRQKDLQRIRPR
jgi:penicillin-binding protein 1A